MKNENKKYNWAFIVVMLLWCFVTLTRCLLHSPWYDEAHAWTIAEQLNLFEIIRLMRLEGHTFIWYLLLMPFAKTNFMYPYSMLLLNWIFCFIAILILWLKSPFNNWIKFLISFSFPFLAMYSVVARCYAIGIMLLFMLAAMDNKKLEHPNWYALLLVVCANTSIMAGVGAFALGIKFLYEMIKEKKFFLSSVVISLFGAVLVLVQLLNSQNSVIFHKTIGLQMFNTLFINGLGVFNLICFCIFVILLLIFYLRNKIFPGVLIITYIGLCLIFNHYIGGYWHHFFFYVYFIISCWLILDKTGENPIRLKQIPIFILISVSLLYLFFKPDKEMFDVVWKNDYTNISKNILSDENLKNAKIIIYRTYDNAMMPYLSGKGIKLINYCTGNLADYNNRAYFLSDYCAIDTQGNQLIVFKESIIDKWFNDSLYLFTTKKIQAEFMSFNSKKYKYSVYKDFGSIYLWKVDKIK